MRVYMEDLEYEDQRVLVHAQWELTEQLREICIREQYFTCGSNEQYTKMFEAAKQGLNSRELAIMIYICSDGVTIEDVSKKIKETVRKYRRVCVSLDKKLKLAPKDRVAKR